MNPNPKIFFTRSRRLREGFVACRSRTLLRKHVSHEEEWSLQIVLREGACGRLCWAAVKELKLSYYNGYI